jgi:ribosomal protein L31
MNTPFQVTKSQMARSVSKAGVRIIKDTLHRRGSLVSDDVYHERLSVCKHCHPHYRSDGRCAECGCVMRLKAKFKFAKCPIGRWDSESEDV